MTIEKNFPSGSITISDLTDAGYLFSQTFYGYTKKEAVQRFKIAFKIENEKNIHVHC